MVGITLWGVKGSTCTDRALFTSHELAVPIDFRPINMMTGEHKGPEHLARQPFGKVPAAEVDGQPFYESRAISRVIARSTSGGEQLFPSSDLKRIAVFEQWSSLEHATITPVLEKVVNERLFKKMRGQEADEDVVRKAIEEGQVGFQVLDKQLSTHDFITGEFSLVDIHMATYVNRFAVLPEGKETLSKYPNIAAWWQRVSSRPAWQKVLSEQTF